MVCHVKCRALHLFLLMFVGCCSAIADCFTDWYPAYGNDVVGLVRDRWWLLPTVFDWFPYRVRKDVVLLVPPPRPSPATQGREIN